MSSTPDVTITSEPLVIDAPTIAEALDNATGLIPASVARAGITVECRTGRISVPTDWLGIQIRTTTDPVPTWRPFLEPFQINLDPVPAIIDRYIPAPSPEFEFPHGFYEIKVVQYRNSNGAPGAARDESNPAAFRVDLIAPYAVASSREQPTVPMLANAPAGTIIDNAFLINHGGVEIVIPRNTFSPQPGRFEAGDIANVYFSPVMDPRPEYLVSGPGVPLLPPPDNSTFFLPASQIILSGLYYFFYTMVDRAGNISRPSFNEFRTVSLLTDPVLLEPFLPLAPSPRDGSTDDVLSIADFVLGINLHIEQYLNFATGLDKFETQWESQPFGPQTTELTGFPVVFSNMNDAIKAAYTATLGPQAVSVRYRTDRNGVFFLSPAKNVRLDLSVEGPVLPGTLEPGDMNPGLNPAQVFGEDSQELNTLRIGDADRPVTIVIRLWTIAAPPHPGNQFYLYWGASKERVGPFPLSTTVPGEDARFIIPWAVVARHGNNLQPVSYSVIGPGTINENPSPLTTVNVIDAVTVELAPARYENLIAGEWTCQSLVQRMPGSPPVLAAMLFIPGDVRLVVGNTVEVTVTITNQYPQLPPGPFVEPITTAPLTAADVANGFYVDIIYRPFLAQAPFGPCEVTYTTNVAGGGIGRGRLAEVFTIFSNPDSFCDGISA